MNTKVNMEQTGKEIKELENFFSEHKDVMVSLCLDAAKLTAFTEDGDEAERVIVSGLTNCTLYHEQKYLSDITRKRDSISLATIHHINNARLDVYGDEEYKELKLYF